MSGGWLRHWRCFREDAYQHERPNRHGVRVTQLTVKSHSLSEFLSQANLSTVIKQ